MRRSPSGATPAGRNIPLTPRPIAPNIMLVQTGARRDRLDRRCHGLDATVAGRRKVTNFHYSKHARNELLLRRIPRAMADGVLHNPQQVVPEREPRKAYQSVVDFGGGRIFLLRAIVDDAADPAIVVTVYRTSKIGKYWRP